MQNQPFTKKDLVLTPGMRLLLLGCVFVICFLITTVLSYLIMRVMSGNTAGAIRISTVMQDLICFIVPAIVTALIVTRRPAELLCLPTRPQTLALFAVAAIMVCSIPVQEAVIYWNYNLKLPAAMADFEAAARAMEDAAGGAINGLLADTSAASLILNILIIGILAGLSEELLFRGCFQRLLTVGGVNPHVAIWAVALTFSALHFQLFGFAPRTLLGAYFGYLLLWTRSIWVPVAAHVLNNTIYVITAWVQVKRNGAEALEASPELPAAWLAILSAAATAAGLYIIYKYCYRKPLQDRP